MFTEHENLSNTPITHTAKKNKQKHRRMDYSLNYRVAGLCLVMLPAFPLLTIVILRYTIITTNLLRYPDTLMMVINISGARLLTLRIVGMG